ncbi:L-serine ammonia-lyase [Propionivibrio sp.]|uniref:L-serine ammonia-lyase n=1 Tax=Propionivibrio sp. TaxID=2212460 RepID=UPI003BF01510
MYYGLFEMFKIGIGPSSSHTFGPMVAAHRFVQTMKTENVWSAADRIQVELFGSLSATGKGHLTDQAIILGLSGFLPEDVDLDKVPSIIAAVMQTRQVHLMPNKKMGFELIFSKKTLKLHENGIQYSVFAGSNPLLVRRYYSIGGGFVVSEEEFTATKEPQAPTVPFYFTNAKELVVFCQDALMSEILMQNELALHSPEEIAHYSQKIWAVMQEGIHRGLKTTGNLPKPTDLARRASALFQKLQCSEEKETSIMVQMDWVNVFALAVSEENGAGGRVVTAPTNGACGVIPAVLAYYDRWIHPLDEARALKFFLVASAIGALFKRNASISGAEVGCQGEIGVASAMAAAGFAALHDADAKQICMAAEIAMEHHLGLTCDPVNGQVQIPCVERNGVAAVTAINATAMALSRSADQARVSLDAVIETMRQTGKDMDPKYRETSCGGLARLIQ